MAAKDLPPWVLSALSLLPAGFVSDEVTALMTESVEPAIRICLKKSPTHADLKETDNYHIEKRAGISSPLLKTLKAEKHEMFTLARTKERAEWLIRHYISLCEGEKVPADFLVFLNDDEGGAPGGLYSDNGMFGICMAPASYWKFLSEFAIAYICAHEMGNALFKPTWLEVEYSDKKAILREQYQDPEQAETLKTEMYKLRIEYELEKSVLVCELYGKLQAEKHAVALLQDAKLSAEGGFEWFEAELAEEQKQTKPDQRMVARQDAIRIRREYLLLLLSEDKSKIDAAESLLQYYKHLSDQVLMANQTPPT